MDDVSGLTEDFKFEYFSLSDDEEYKLWEITLLDGIEEE